VTNTISRAPQIGQVGGLSSASRVDVGASSSGDCLIVWNMFQARESRIQVPDLGFQAGQPHREVADLAAGVLVFLPRNVERAPRQRPLRGVRPAHPAGAPVAHGARSSRRRASFEPASSNSATLAKPGLVWKPQAGLDYDCRCTAAFHDPAVREVLTMSATVREMLRGKSNVYAVRPSDTVYDALRLMADKNIGAVLVRSDQQIDGILSERDYARKVILLGKTSKETLVSEIMTTRVVSVDPDWTADQCMALMTEKRIRHLPVIEQGGLVGIVSIGDVVRAVVDEQQFTIDSLQRYITS
jgi:CBS domain-containing protein